MKTTASGVLAVALTAGVFLAGSWHNQRTAARQTSGGGRKVLYYVDPMHPAYKADSPGIAPDCGMALVPVYEDEAAGDPLGDSPAAAGPVRVSPEKQRLIGVHVGRVEKAPATQALRLFGRVAADETRVYPLIAGSDGFIREVSAVTTGSRVRKDQWLATFSAPDSRRPVESYLVALSVIDRARQEGQTSTQIGAAEAGVGQTADQLLNLGMSRLQLEEITRTRQVATSIRILAPVDGFVMARRVSLGQLFERGMEWYRIADLTRVWVFVDVYRDEARYLRPGGRALVSLPDRSGTLTASVAEVLPHFDGATQTLKVRLELDNPGYVLRPDMFVDVEVPVTLPAAIAVPVDAVLDSGLRKVVFVDRGEGAFEPRQVETGWCFGDRVEIVKGLEPGERIVVEGAFLLDSESRMRSTRSEAAPAGHDHDGAARAGADAAPDAAAHGTHVHVGSR